MCVAHTHEPNPLDMMHGHINCFDMFPHKFQRDIVVQTQPSQSILCNKLARLGVLKKLTTWKTKGENLYYENVSRWKSHQIISMHECYLFAGVLVHAHCSLEKFKVRVSKTVIVFVRGQPEIARLDQLLW